MIIKINVDKSLDARKNEYRVAEAAYGVTADEVMKRAQKNSIFNMFDFQYDEEAKEDFENCCNQIITGIGSIPIAEVGSTLEGNRIYVFTVDKNNNASFSQERWYEYQMIEQGNF